MTWKLRKFVDKFLDEIFHEMGDELAMGEAKKIIQNQDKQQTLTKSDLALDQGSSSFSLKEFQYKKTDDEISSETSPQVENEKKSSQVTSHSGYRKNQEVELDLTPSQGLKRDRLILDVESLPGLQNRSIKQEEEDGEDEPKAAREDEQGAKESQKALHSEKWKNQKSLSLDLESSQRFSTKNKYARTSSLSKNKQHHDEKDNSEEDEGNYEEADKKLSRLYKFILLGSLLIFCFDYFLKLEPYLEIGSLTSLGYVSALAFGLFIIGILIFSYIQENVSRKIRGRSIIMILIGPIIVYLGMSTYFAECKKFIPFDRWLYRFEAARKYSKNERNFHSLHNIKKMHEAFLSIYEELPEDLQKGPIGLRTNLYRLFVASELPTGVQNEILRELRDVFSDYAFREDEELVKALSSLAIMEYKTEHYEESFQNAQKCIRTAMKLDLHKSELKVFDCHFVYVANQLRNGELEESKSILDTLWEWNHPNSKKKYLTIMTLLDLMVVAGQKDEALEKYHGILEIYRENRAEHKLLIHVYKKLEDLYKEKQDFARQEVYHGHRKVLEESVTLDRSKVKE